MVKVESCFIWRTWAEGSVNGAGGDSYDVYSPRAGGKYRIEGVLAGRIYNTNLTDDEKIKLTDWLIEEREKGEEEPPYIDEKILGQIKTGRKKAMSERIKSLMLFLAKEYEVSDLIDITDGGNSAMLLTAYSSSLNSREMDGCADYCASVGYLEALGTTTYCMTVQGKIYAEEIIKEDKQKRQCFVAMWFDKETDDAYEKAIIPAIEDAGYKPYRVDKDHHNGKIDDLIIAEIRNSRFIIADFTSKPKEPRGGVYFEAGFAYGLEIPVIWTCQQKLIKHLHFDTRQYNHIPWDNDNLPDFRKRIYYSIGKNVGWSEDAKVEDTSSSK